MNLKVQIFGFPEIEKALGKELNIQIKGNTLGDLIQFLQESHGIIFKGAFVVKILRNGCHQMIGVQPAHSLNEGDHVTFFNMLAGG